MGNIGFPELVIIFIVVLLLFGPKRLPDLGRSLGRGLAEFRRASTDLKNSIEREVESAELERSLREAAAPPSKPGNPDGPQS